MKKKDSAVVRAGARRLYEMQSTTSGIPNRDAAVYFVGGRILDALALVLENQERALESEV